MAAWTGFGWLAYAIVVGTFFGTVAVLDHLFGPGFSQQHSIVAAIGTFIVSSALCWPVGRHLNRHLPFSVFDSDWAWRGHTTAHSAFFVRLEFGALAVLPFLIAVAFTGVDGLFRK